MTWYDCEKVLPPCDGVYETKDESTDRMWGRLTPYTELRKYNGLTFSGYESVSHWRYPVVENVEKRYGVQK
jgi:hypothetical protein